MDIQAQQRIFLDIFDHLGVPYRFVEDYHRRQNVWDGKEYCFGKHEGARIMSHELAHWIVATHTQRGWPEYGLGVAPDSTIGHTKREMPMSKANDIEAEASFLGLSILKALGLPYEDEADDQGWVIEEFESRYVEEGEPEILIDTLHLRN